MPQLVVGVGDGKVTKSREDVLTTFALGSCVAVIAHDATAGVGGLLHVMLPSSDLDAAKAAARPCMFADSGMRELLAGIRKLGADLRRTSVWLAGGAQVLATSDSLAIGKRNYQAVRKMLWKEGLLVKAEEVGGTHCRTVRLDMNTGQAWIRTCSAEADAASNDRSFEWRLMS